MTNIDGSTPAHELDEIEAERRNDWIDFAFRQYVHGEDHQDLSHGYDTLQIEIVDSAIHLADMQFVGNTEEKINAKERYENAVRVALNTRYTELEANEGSL
jgi:hypothetical protein